ncbi:hypothetical protein RRG08_052326, partial [Elysia crispata]
MIRDAAQRFMHIKRNRDISLRTRSRKRERKEYKKGIKRRERTARGENYNSTTYRQRSSG